AVQTTAPVIAKLEHLDPKQPRFPRPLCQAGDRLADPGANPLPPVSAALIGAHHSVQVAVFELRPGIEEALGELIEVPVEDRWVQATSLDDHLDRGVREAADLSDGDRRLDKSSSLLLCLGAAPAHFGDRGGSRWSTVTLGL